MTIKSENATAETVSFNLAAGSAADRLSVAVTAINDRSAKTGVTASLSEKGDYIVLPTLQALIFRSVQQRMWPMPTL